ncbi:oxidoreductase [Mycobacterium sp. NPDC003449]
MNIALIGPGAIGATVAALLYDAGHQVALYGRTPRASIELRDDHGGPVTVPGPVYTNPADAPGPADVVLLGVKDTQNDSAADWLAKLCDQNTVVLALQNGVEQVARVGRFCPASTVVPAVIWFSSATHPDGWIRLRTPARMVLPDDDAGRRLADVLRTQRLTIDLDSDFVTAAWHKLLVNAVAGLMVLTGRKFGMFHRADTAALARSYLAECLTVARAEGARLGDDVLNEMATMLVELPQDMTTSMLTDRELGRPLEWDIRNGVVVRKAREHGLTTPIGDILVPLLAAASDGPG